MIELEKKLEYEFSDKQLLANALSHSSYANENRKIGALSNERLEFLGDAVLGVTVAEYLYRCFSTMPEGRMTKMRAEMVCEQSLFEVANKLGLGEYLLLGHGEEIGGGRERPSILADAVEALIAAMYLDGGKAPALKFIHHWIIEPFDSSAAGASHDYKTALQELAQRESGQKLSYELVEESGPDHHKEFKMSVLLNGELLGMGTGRTKKEAEQAAARAALQEWKR